MHKVVRPFGLFGPEYRTDTLGAACVCATYLPAILLIGLTAMGQSPVATPERGFLSLLISLLFITPLLAVAIARSTRVR